jgi:hypothetical protein
MGPVELFLKVKEIYQKSPGLCMFRLGDQ